MSDSTPQGRLTPGAPHSHEQSTINVRTILLFGVGLTAMVALVQVMLGLAINWISHDETPKDERFPQRHAIEVNQFPTPRLQVNPEAELASIKQQELARLESYGWVDQSAGIAHIPIDRALDILATQGLPKIPAPELKPGEAAPIGVSPLPVSRDDTNPGRAATPSAEPKKSGETSKKESPR